MAADRTPRFYFSLRSPYSWLAYRTLLDEYPDIAAAVEWRPFFEPDQLSEEMLTEAGGSFPYTPMSRAKHLYVLQDVGRLAKARGLRLTWPVDRAPVWEVPHLAYLVALREGRGPEYIAAAYRARWEEGRDICDPAVVADIATGIGIDARAAAGAADDPGLRREGLRLLHDIDRDGVFGVPFFVHGYSRFWGLDRLGDFVGHLRQRTAPAGRLPEPVGAAVGLGPRSVDDGHAGGCG
ncbi:2-hydroxychromene-2-carboxylate isomerase [Streptomyces venezuelae]|uniref:2-hydroxychromene-2-carboxylate isomerase n=1 Tax=Streptomyces venezuelae TaxID=54571 RepID=UPI00123C55AC|nr:DsbA family protein [Streptomyces venezuelae]QES09319.1 2-hydroxychromene-2-carboxylate isomerase [Streptomyces venezuelae]